MSRRNALLVLGAAVLVASLWPCTSSAAPVFARKYGFNCSMCHSAFPRLNDFGIRFRDHGYRVPGREGDELTVMQASTPLAARVTSGFVYAKEDTASDPELNQLMVNGLDILSGGMLGDRAGYFAIFPPRLEGSRSVADQPGTVEMANVNFLLLGRDRLNLRVGRFEPAAVAFSVKRHLGFEPYDIYDATFPGGAPLSETQNGLEFASRLPCGLRCAVGLLNGCDTNRTTDDSADAYLRLAWLFGAGEGQTAGQRVGLVGYTGRARPDPALSRVALKAPGDMSQRNFQRLGIDASLNWRQVNLAVLGLMEKAEGNLWGVPPDATSGERPDVTNWGGFAELTCQPMASLVLLGRYDLVRMADGVKELGTRALQDRSRLTAVARYFLEDHLAVHGEYSHQASDTAPAGEKKVSRNSASLGLDFAF